MATFGNKEFDFYGFVLFPFRHKAIPQILDTGYQIIRQKLIILILYWKESKNLKYYPLIQQNSYLITNNKTNVDNIRYLSLKYLAYNRDDRLLFSFCHFLYDIGFRKQKIYSDIWCGSSIIYNLS